MRATGQLAGYWAFLVYALTHLGALRVPPVRAVFERQLYTARTGGTRNAPRWVSA